MPRNQNKFVLDCELIEKPSQVFDFGQNYIVRPIEQEVTFFLVYYENGCKIWKRSWKAQFSEYDFDYEENLAAKIIQQLKQPADVGIWDSNPIIYSGEEWNSIVEISNKALQIFAFLKNPLQQWLESSVRSLPKMAH